ncbi:hypothetical protein M153_1470003942 [Pseudoloma neurophilia]|uniref:Uncharacterized protein n=1 Tax=Pseudoloma neurophilia TaxID=146866 RepID=A0A0R0M5F4_9MICR|nr:hypothetical protein M153_1470003942 [Pseudoloma neurophilia]
MLIDKTLDSRPHFNVLLNNTSKLCLVDSGATDCYMSDFTVNELNLSQEKVNVICKTAGGTQKIEKQVLVMVKTPNVEKDIKFFVLNSLRPDEIILGYDTCRELNIAFEPEVTTNELGFQMLSPKEISVKTSEIIRDKKSFVEKNDLSNIDERIIQV